MISNPGEFEREMDLLVDLPERELVPLHRAAHHDYFAGVVARTPRDTGEAVSGWHTTVGHASDRKPSGSFDRSGAATLAAIIAQSDAVLAGALVPFTRSFGQNAVEHVYYLDKGLMTPPNPGVSKDPRPHRKGRLLVAGGYSTQAPKGIVDITHDEVLAKYRGIAARL